MSTWAQPFVCSDTEWEYEITDDNDYKWAADPWLVFAPTQGQRDRNGDVVREFWNTRLSPDLFPLPFSWSGLYVLGGQSAHVDGTREWSFSVNVPDPATFRCKQIWAGVPMGFHKSYGVGLRGRDRLDLWQYRNHPTPYKTRDENGGMEFVETVPDTVAREIEDRVARLERWIDRLRAGVGGPVPTCYTRTNPRAKEKPPHPTQCPVCLGPQPGNCKCVPYWGKSEEYPSWAELQETLAGATWYARENRWLP
jgi:hypothetical protein